MYVDNEKYVINIKSNIREIKNYFEHLTDEEISEVYQDLKDVFLFYGYKNAANGFLMKYFISDTAVSPRDENLSELEGITNSILFHLKYKYKRKSS